MYPPRSEKRKQRKQEKQHRQNRLWVLINLTLISLIIVLGTYFYLEERTRQDSAGNGAEQTGGDPNIALGNQEIMKRRMSLRHRREPVKIPLRRITVLRPGTGTPGQETLLRMTEHP